MDNSEAHWTIVYAKKENNNATKGKKAFTIKIELKP